MKEFKFEYGSVYRGDCIDYLERCVDNQFGLILVDPPYGINENSYRVANRAKLAKTKDYGEFDWDKDRLDDKYIRQFLRVSNNQIIWGGNYYADLLPASKSWIVWDKDNTCDYADVELAWTSHDKAAKKVKCRWNGMLQYNLKQKFKENRIHPTQKPEPVIEFCIDNYYEGGVILDPCAGSCTTAVICERKKKPWVCIEKSERHFNDAVMRLQNLQVSLF